MAQKKNGKGKNQGHNLSDKGKMKHSNKDANRRCEIISREPPITMFHDDAQQKRISAEAYRKNRVQRRAVEQVKNI